MINQNLDLLTRPTPTESGLTDLGQRLVRFGHALQEQRSTVAELASLANACGIRFQIRAVATHPAAHADAAITRELTPCA